MENGDTLFSANSRSSLLLARGRWEFEGNNILFTGTILQPENKKGQEVKHRLAFDGDDLFNKKLRIRLQHQN